MARSLCPPGSHGNSRGVGPGTCGGIALASLLELAGVAFGALGTGGVFGAWLLHRRLGPKSEAEAVQMNWERFQKEIERLDKKVTAQGKRIDQLEREVEECHRQKTDIEIENMRLRAAQEVTGEARKLAAGIVAVERIQGGKE